MFLGCEWLLSGGKTGRCQNSPATLFKKINRLGVCRHSMKYEPVFRRASGHFGGQVFVVAFSGMRRFFEFLCFADVYVLQYCAKENRYCRSCFMSWDCSFLKD